LILRKIHKIDVKIGEKTFKATVGFSKLGIGSLEEKIFLKDLKFVLTKKRKSWSL